MKNNLLIVLLFLACLSSCVNEASANKNVPDKDVLFQYSTISALQAGLFDGQISIGELKKSGDFGIGTFNSLDGEMVAFENEFMQIKSDGKLYQVEDSLKSPFAVVTFFKPDIDTTFSDISDFSQLSSRLDSIIPSNNIFYAFAIKGDFASIKVRSVPKQEKPYRTLVEVIANQPVFEYKNISGTLIGFRMPGFADGFNVPLYHLHFIDKEKKVGGHLLAFEKFSGDISIDFIHKITLSLPNTTEFEKINLNRDKEEIYKVEK